MSALFPPLPHCIPASQSDAHEVGLRLLLSLLRGGGKQLTSLAQAWWGLRESWNRQQRQQREEECAGEDASTKLGKQLEELLSAAEEA